jgi:competence protein ComEC
MLKRAWIAAIFFLFLAGAAQAAKTLDIYFIDVEGGQSTLIVTPAGQSLLVDTGFAGNSFNDFSNRGRDARRILAAVRDAGIKRIDYLLITHFHGDHAGGVVDLAAEIPIDTFIDHDNVLPETEQDQIGTRETLAGYAAVRAKGRRHINAKPGDRISMKDVEAVIVASAGKTIQKPLRGRGQANTACRLPVPAQEKIENPRSTGFVLQFGKFRFLDVGDLVGEPLFNLICPVALIDPVDVYLIAHHGAADAADPATFAAFRPRVAILNNGVTKGGDPAMFQTLRGLQGIDVWQLHQSANSGVQNFAADHIANLDTTTSHWLKLSADADGSFRITNGRTGLSKEWKKKP